VLAQTLMRLMLALSVLDPGRARLAAPGRRAERREGRAGGGDAAGADGVGGRWWVCCGLVCTALLFSIDIVLIVRI
jgi:hypothetical protein